MKNVTGAVALATAMLFGTSALAAAPYALAPHQNLKIKQLAKKGTGNIKRGKGNVKKTLEKLRHRLARVRTAAKAAKLDAKKQKAFNKRLARVNKRLAKIKTDKKAKVRAKDIRRARRGIKQLHRMLRLKHAGKTSTAAQEAAAVKNADAPAAAPAAAPAVVPAAAPAAPEAAPAAAPETK